MSNNKVDLKDKTEKIEEEDQQKPESKTDLNEEKEVEIKEEDVLIPKPDKELLDKLTKSMQELYEYQAKYTINDDGSVTFYPTPNCEAAKQMDQYSKPQKISMKGVLAQENCSNVEAFSDPNVEVIAAEYKLCSFINAAMSAWSSHYPFRFKVEHIWLLILQNVAVHVDQNAEKLRQKYVTHDGKKELNVVRDEFVLGSPKNDWNGVINEFVEQIDKNTVNDTCKLFDCDFTSSTLIEKIATKVTIMDICKNYFKYSMWTTCCGFPQITLDGTKQDWIKLKQKVIKLLNEKVDKKFGKEWGQSLLPLLDRFIVAFDGKIDCLFWNSMIKRGGTRGSGSYSYLCGWFNILFPLFSSGNSNGYCSPYSMNRSYVRQALSSFHNDDYCPDKNCGHDGGNDSEKYPRGLASAPVTWTYLGKKLELKFIAGFVGYNQNPKTLEICPNISWCIAHKMNEKEIKEKQAKNKSNYW